MGDCKMTVHGFAVPRMLATVAAIAMLACSAHGRAKVVVMHGETSQRDVAERRFAKSLANHAVRWLRDCGVEADLAPDTEMKANLAGRKVAILIHCPEPTASQLQALRGFKSGGGRLIVTYSSSQGLADIVGVKVGKYSRDASRAGMSFARGAVPGIPGFVAQSSPNIVEAFPVQGRSRTIAWWADANGRRGGDAAWLAGDGGYWMTHVLLADGDALQKGRLLLSLAASIEPSLWREAAEKRLGTAVSAGSWKTLADGRTSVARIADPSSREQAMAEINAAETSAKASRELVRQGRARDAWFFAEETSRHVQMAYGYCQSPRQGEIRAVWDHSGCGLYPGDWAKTCEVLASSGITDIFLNTASPVAANCRLKTVPPSQNCERYGDQLAACIKAARPRGIRVHAWIFCFSVSGAGKERREAFRRDGWLVDKTSGGQQDWLDPSSAAVRAKITSIASEIMGKYGIDGIHLDFIRYQDYYNSLGYGTRSRFQRDANGGAEIADWGASARKPPLFGRIVRWRCRQVTSMVAAIRNAQRKIRPNIVVSAAVLGKYPTCVESVGQDWMSWLENGHIDYAMPMNYTESLETFNSLLDVQTARKAIARKIVGGIGVTAAESRLDTAKTIDQIEALRRRGAAGFILFDLDATLGSEILPSLRATRR